MKYNPSVHAVERVREYFGIMEEHAKNFVNQLMESAKYVTTEQSGRLVYKHEGKDVMIVVDSTGKHVITVLPPTGRGKTNAAIPSFKFGDSVIFEKARATIKRELTKAQHQFTREFRTLAERQALVQIEIAQLTLNKVRAKNPKTQAVIQTNIDVALGMFDEIGKALGELSAEYERVKREAQAFVGTEVGA